MNDCCLTFPKELAIVRLFTDEVIAAFWPNVYDLVVGYQVVWRGGVSQSSLCFRSKGEVFLSIEGFDLILGACGLVRDCGTFRYDKSR